MQNCLCCQAIDCHVSFLKYYIIFRAGPELIDAMHMIVVLLPGTPIIYYGEEIGMTDGIPVSDDVREGCRTPMQWSDGPNAGLHWSLHFL